MKNVPLLIGTLVVTLLLVVGVAVAFSQSDQPKNVDPALIMGDARFSKGPTSAKVTIVEFSDLQCPACKAVEPMVRQVTDKYPNDVRLIYRQFPLVQIHKNAQRAALAAEAVGEMGKFWQMHDILFDNQEEWAELSPDEVKVKFDSYLAKIAVDKSEFEKRIGSQEVSDRITKDISDGTKAGVDATPTFYVNGQKTPAPQLLSTVDNLVTQK